MDRTNLITIVFVGYLLSEAILYPTMGWINLMVGLSLLMSLGVYHLWERYLANNVIFKRELARPSPSRMEEILRDNSVEARIRVTKEGFFRVSFLSTSPGVSRILSNGSGPTLLSASNDSIGRLPRTIQTGSGE